MPAGTGTVTEKSSRGAADQRAGESASLARRRRRRGLLSPGGLGRKVDGGSGLRPALRRQAGWNRGSLLASRPSHGARAFLLPSPCAPIGVQSKEGTHMKNPVQLDTIVSLAKRRGFVFQSSEIYGGFASTYD